MTLISFTEDQLFLLNEVLDNYELELRFIVDNEMGDLPELTAAFSELRQTIFNQSQR
jgi:hypothetical protein